MRLLPRQSKASVVSEVTCISSQSVSFHCSEPIGNLLDFYFKCAFLLREAVLKILPRTASAHCKLEAGLGSIRWYIQKTGEKSHPCFTRLDHLGQDGCLLTDANNLLVLWVSHILLIKQWLCCLVLEDAVYPYALAVPRSAQRPLSRPCEHAWSWVDVAVNRVSK